MRTLALVCLLTLAPVWALALGNNQLYTGDPSTVSPGKTQFQLYTDASKPNQARLGGVAFRRGLTSNTELKLAYSYLWNFDGPDVSTGPNMGIKWRFAGDGRKKPSLAVSALWARTGISGQPNRDDRGATLIGSYPTRYGEILANFGRVWIGSNTPDLRFVSLAAVRPVAKRTIVALEYSSLTRIGSGGPSPLGRQIAAGMVYLSGSGWSYGFQAGYLVDNPKFKWHTTVGVATYF